MPIPAVPTLMLAGGAMALVLGRGVQQSRWYEGIWLATLLGAAWLLIAGDVPTLSADGSRLTWSSDSFSVAGSGLALISGLLFGMGSFGIRSSSDLTASRLGSLSFLIAGVMLVGSSIDLVTMALSFEIVQFASWALRKVDRLESVPSHEVSPEPTATGDRDETCLWVGIVSSCCLWLGIALLANVTASTHYDEIRRVLTDAYVPNSGRAAIGAGSKLGLLAIGLIVAGLGGRLGLVPWQIAFRESGRNVGYWTAGCVLVEGQLAAILALARLCGTVWAGYRDELLILLLVLAGLTFVVSGALSGLGLLSGEGRLRRWAISIPMLHGAWLTVGLLSATADLASPEQSLATAGQPGALAILLFSCGAGMLGLTGLFVLLDHLSRDNRDVEFIDELLGLGRLRPGTAGPLMVVLASLIGQPPLWGFWSNWLLLVAGLNVRAEAGRDDSAPHAGMLLLLVLATIATLMTAGVVIRFARVIFLEQPISRTLPQGRRAALVTGLCCAVLLLVVGLYPARILGILSQVRGPIHKSIDEPAGSSRGSATAVVEPENATEEPVSSRAISKSARPALPRTHHRTRQAPLRQPDEIRVAHGLRMREPIPPGSHQ